MSKLFKLRTWQPRTVQITWFLICASFLIITAFVSIVQIMMDSVLYPNFSLQICALNATTAAIVAGIGTLLAILISRHWLKTSHNVDARSRFGFKIMNWTSFIIDDLVFIAVFVIDYFG